MKNKFLVLWFVLLLLLFLGSPLFFREALGRSRPQELLPAREMNLFLSVVSLIKSDYVDDISSKKLMDGALKGTLKSLDPYSQFLDAESYEDLKIGTEGKFGGLGLEVGIKGGLLYVISPLDDTPAQLAGIRAGDTIIKIDDEPTRDMALHDAVRKMRGAPGSVVKLTLMREGENKLLDLRVARDVVKIKSIKDAKLLENHVGYIRISAFQEKSAEEFEKALRSLMARGMSGLILDVRNNSGGLLKAAAEVTEKFIPDGKLIVSTKGRNPKKNTQFISQMKRPYEIRPLVVLVNKGSASGSEILAGAIQDYGLGSILGVRTFGKGSVQSLVPLPEGSAIRITTSKYYTPKGRLIHEVGISPDVVVEWKEDKSTPDIQLERALNLVHELKNQMPHANA